jgi:hypothetical protein
VEQLSITLKKAETSNIRKCLVTKYRWVEKMKSAPAEFLVFTGEIDHTNLIFGTGINLVNPLACR